MNKPSSVDGYCSGNCNDYPPWRLSAVLMTGKKGAGGVRGHSVLLYCTLPRPATGDCSSGGSRDGHGPPPPKYRQFCGKSSRSRMTPSVIRYNRVSILYGTTSQGRVKHYPQHLQTKPSSCGILKHFPSSENCNCPSDDQ
ncbi:hypothetical protein J6590_054386 [Homalodisca vitripennis]|nr:hypothetical protein J6590_054386 [Homalodisca vitripennis]